MRTDHDNALRQAIETTVNGNHARVAESLDWLRQQMHPYFFLGNGDEVEAIANLAANLPGLASNRRITLADRDGLLILAQVGAAGSLFAALRELPERPIGYAQMTTSYGPLPGTGHPLEVLRFNFGLKGDDEIAAATCPPVAAALRAAVAAILRRDFPEFDQSSLDAAFGLFGLNQPDYLRTSPAERIARMLWLYEQTRSHDGLFLDLQPAGSADGGNESRLLFGIGNPPPRGFLLQTMEIFQRLGLHVQRAHALTLSDGIHPYFLAAFDVRLPGDGVLSRDSDLYAELQEELYNTQLLPPASQTYHKLVTTGIASGAEGSLIRALIGFCHTNLAHTHPESFDLEGIVRAFHNHPDIALQLVRLFRSRFQPGLAERDQVYADTLTATERMVESYNTGRGFLDEFRRVIFRCALAFVRHTLKTNYFVPAKHALAFRLDPAYLDDLDPEFVKDLPAERPFRITYFFSRFGCGYHIGFSDIARGGWRTLITQGRDDYVTAANTLFKENYVLAHTQHLKNKDIYEGGSKLVAVLDAGGASGAAAIRQLLYKLQYGFANAFLDLFVTEHGRAKNPQVLDYYGEDEPIELGPDENMHDSMIELIAAQAVKRGYLLGAGIMSSKRIGINHKEYGVTSIGVLKFAEVAMQQLGIDIRRDSFSVKLTGGPNGDVAGNALRLLLERSPQAKIVLIVDGSAALYDPAGIDREELARIVLAADLEAFNPAALHPGGCLLYRSRTRQQGMRKLFGKVVRTGGGLVESWVSNDDFFNEYNNLLFQVAADLFIPAGGRPETIDDKSWRKLLDAGGIPNTRVIVEGANSFITPEARAGLQQHGVLVLRDASANKCGVISSSYEIIANLLLSETEFLAEKSRYVADVIEILNRRAEDEARLIFHRHRETGGTQLLTEISAAISREINQHYARLFDYFQKRPHLCSQPLYRTALLQHLPRMIREDGELRDRIDRLPQKIRFAILASEIASSLVYHGDRDSDYAELIERHLLRMSPI
jgi:glutamate dehydrogenase